MKRSIQIAGLLCICALLAAGLTPRTVRAVAASLVQVVNTAANPVAARDVDNADRNAVALQCFVELLPQNEQDNVACRNGQLSAVFTVPHGMRLVLDHVSGRVLLPPGQSIFDIGLLLSEGQSSVELQFAPTLMNTAPSRLVYLFSTPVHGYADADSTIFIQLGRSDGPDDAFASAQIEGHLVDCTGGCAAY